MFSCVWLHFKKFSEKYFLVFGEEEGKDKPDKPRRRRRRCDLDLRKIAIDGTIAPLVDRRGATIGALRSGLSLLSLSLRSGLSLPSLFLTLFPEMI